MQTAPTILPLLLVLSLASVAPASVVGDATGDGVMSVADGVQIMRAAAGLSSVCTVPACDLDASGFLSVTDGASALRIAGGLPAAPQPSAPAIQAGNPIDVRFRFETATTIQGFHVEITYPLAAGGFAGSADAVSCASNGAGAFIANDRDDGTMALIQTDVVALTFPVDVTCRFEQTAGAPLQASDLRYCQKLWIAVWARSSRGPLRAASDPPGSRGPSSRTAPQWSG